jgi:hypothetical protein
MDELGAGPRRSSLEGAAIWEATVAGIPAAEGAPTAAATATATALSPDISAASTIMADLDALQREVDALRGQYEKSGGYI